MTTADAAAPLVVDLHGHYPMHLLESAHRRAGAARPALARDRVQAAVMWAANRIGNYGLRGPRVTLEQLERGGVRVVLSVLYDPFCEIDLSQRYGAPPRNRYFGDLLEQLERVEHSIRLRDPDGTRVTVVATLADLERALAHGQVALLHCVEGGYHLGAEPEQIAGHVAELARRGVVYVTLAHLFWRGVASNDNAIPFIPDRLYHQIFRQAPGSGLSELGAAAVRAMYRSKVLIDVAHMRQDALDATFALLDELDAEHRAPPRGYPVIASHVGFRHGTQRYNLDRQSIERIAARGGVIGLIMAQHQLNDGVRARRTADLDASIEVLCAHIDTIAEITGSHDHVAIGTDLDGFIRPLGGLQRAGDLRQLHAPLAARYGRDTAERILAGNALRVLHTALAARQR